MTLPFCLTGSRPESSEGDHPAYQNAHGGIPGAHHGNAQALLDPMAISLMPPEFERPLPPPPTQGNRISQLSQQLQMAQLTSGGEAAANDGIHRATFAPKGSLV